MYLCSERGHVADRGGFVVPVAVAVAAVVQGPQSFGARFGFDEVECVSGESGVGSRAAMRLPLLFWALLKYFVQSLLHLLGNPFDQLRSWFVSQHMCPPAPVCCLNMPHRCGVANMVVFPKE
jgi:hypothetical protein